MTNPADWKKVLQVLPGVRSPVDVVAREIVAELRPAGDTYERKTKTVDASEQRWPAPTIINPPQNEDARRAVAAIVALNGITHTAVPLAVDLSNWVDRTVELLGLATTYGPGS